MTLRVSADTIPIRDNGDPMVDLARFDLVLEPAYYLRGYSTDAKMYLRESVALRLVELQMSLPKGCKFKIWDGWRPRELQLQIYHSYFYELKTNHPEWDEQKLHEATGIFVASATNPNVPPPHSTGGAVDLTIVGVDGFQLNMGTGFDHFGPEARFDYYEKNKFDKEICHNRYLLRDIMFSGGFATRDSEWWDYNYGTQYWAATVRKPYAIFGEVVAQNDRLQPMLDESRTVEP